MKRLCLPLLTLLFLLASCAAVPASQAEEFSFQEIAPVFALTDEEIFSRYGAPLSEEQVSYHGMPAHEFHYDGAVYRTEALSGCLYYAYFDAPSPDFPPPRGIGIGAKLREVLAAYAADGDNTRRTAPDGTEYVLLYGDYEEGHTYGAVFYDRGKARLLEYCSEGCLIAYGIDGGKVRYMEYVVK